MKKIVIAIGGNALLKNGETPNFETHVKNISNTARIISKIANYGIGIIITHGNGPQVGDELIRNEMAKKYMPKLPLHILTAETQAYIGSIFVSSINPMLKGLHKRNAVSVITHALVDKNDPSIKKPSKQIGPYYTKKQLEKELKLERFAYVKEKGFYRMVVPSPNPTAILEIDAIRDLLKKGYVPICGGGGGIPVYTKKGLYYGVNAVIDKDKTSALIAIETGVDEMIILTEADSLYYDFEHKKGKIKDISCKEAKMLLPELEAGTIRPKLESCINFAERTGRIAKIGSLDRAIDVYNGKAGTTIRP